MDEETKQAYRNALLEYCKLDTLAMVKVLEKLRECMRWVNLLNNLFKLQTNLNDDTIETIVNRIQKFQNDLVKHCMAIS